MKTLEIVFTKSRKKLPIGSWLIRLWTKKSYSHVARRFTWNDWGAGFYQANEGKVNYEHERVFLTKHEIVKEYKIEIPDEIEMQIRKHCWQDAGVEYGILQNLGIMLVDLLKIIGIKISNPWKKGRNCSELIYVDVLKVLHPELNYDPDTIKPHDIEEILESSIWKKD